MSPRTVPIASIAIGERDRADMGDITALADSIKVVGLLHPVVVTEALTLVAGGRRLEATRRLGWTEVPVTVVDLTTVADALRAECDENVQRKPLNAIEASRARERRMRVLAEDAKRRQREHGHTAPGRPRTENTSTNFVEVSPPPATSRPVATRVPNAAGPASKPEPPRHQRERRSAAIVDSNFSSTTLGDALANGAYEHWKNWNNADKKIRVFHNGSLVPARAMRGVRRRNDAGLIEHQQSFWPEMTWAEVQQQIDGAEQRIAAEEVTKSIGFKLLRLLIQAPDSTGPGDACKAIGEDFETYLGLTA